MDCPVLRPVHTSKWPFCVVSNVDPPPWLTFSLSRLTNIWSSISTQTVFVKANAESAEQSQHISSSSPVLSQSNLPVPSDSRFPGYELHTCSQNCRRLDSYQVPQTRFYNLSPSHPLSLAAL